MKKNRKEKKLLLGIFAFCGLFLFAGCSRKASSENQPEPFVLAEALKEDEAAGEDSAEPAAEAEALDGTMDGCAEEKVCFVHICGAVKAPGVYQIEKGSRIFTVVDMAGGFLETACQSYVNLAEPVSDGQRIYIPTLEEAADLVILQQTDDKEAADGKININTAQAEELCTLPGIGAAKADAIIAYRSEHGSFKQIEDIMKVTGIKQSGYEKLRERITVGQE